MAEVRSGSFRTTGYSDANSPDHYVFSWTLASQSIVDNTTTINWEVVAAGGATAGYYNTVREKYVTVYGATKSDSTAQTTYNGTKPFSGTTVIKHDSNGKGSFSASCGGAFEFSGAYNSTGSGSWDLPTIARATTPVLAATTITMGSSINITLTPANSTFKHKLRYDFGSVKGSASGFSMGAEFTAQGTKTVTFTPPTSLGSQIPNNLSGTGQIICYTYTSSGTHIGTTYVKITLNIPSYTPSITGVTLTGNKLLSSAYVQGKSSVTVNATTQTSYGANIKSITSVIDGKSYSGLPFTTGALSSGSKTVKITLVDTRDKSVTVESAAIQVYAYATPNITEFTLARQTDGTTVIATVKGSISAINNKNGKTIKVTLNGVTNTITSSSYAISATTTFTSVPTDNTLTAKAVFTDSYVSIERAATLPTVAVTMDFYKNGDGIAMGKVAEYGDLLDVNWPLRARKIATIDGLVTFKNHLYHHGHIYMGGNKTATGENHIKFSNPDTSANPHNVYIYGGNPSSNVAIGLYDAGNSRQVAAYVDADNTISIGNGSAKINFNGNRLNDFVVEQGTNSSWGYRKWNNGVSECWRIVSMATGTFSGTSPAFYCTPGTKYNYPSGLFTSVTDVQMTVALNGGGVITAFNCSGIDTTYCEPGFIRLYGGSASLNVSVSIHIMGRWK